MNPEFKVLTNANESNLQEPLIQNRFRKLTLQSPKQLNVQRNWPERLPPPESKLATVNFVKPSVSPYKSQTITNKLMLSTSSGNDTERTNFINVETEPFTNPIQVESTENELFSNLLQVKNAENQKNSQKDISGGLDDNKELTSQMEKLEVSRVSADLFSQFSSTSRLSLPPNRILSNKENVEYLSQRMSNICMSDHGDLADTQPNTSSQFKSKSKSDNNAIEPPTNGPSSPVILISDGEEENNYSHNSLLTEESEDEDSVIEVLSSEDDNFEVTEDHVPHNVSPINTQADDVELTESVALKLNHFFDNIPNLDASLDNYQKIGCDNDKPLGSDVTIPETQESDNEKQGKNVDRTNALALDASHSDKSDKRTTYEDISEMQRSNHQNVDNQQNDSLKSSSGEPDQTSIRHTRLGESDTKTSTKDNESESQSFLNESSSVGSSVHLNRSTNEKQLSIRQSDKRMESEKIKTAAKNVFRVNSPIINVTARVNINIQVSGFSSSSSDTDATSENADDRSSVVSSKNNESLLSETGVNSSEDVVAHCRQALNNISSSKKFVDASPNYETTETEEDNDDAHAHNSEISLGSVIESSLIERQHADHNVENESEENSTSDICKSMTSIHIVAKESSTEPCNSSKGKESIDADVSKQDEHNVSVLPVDSSVEIDEIGEQLLTDIYGDTWRTPQLIKKCMSTKKKYFTDASKRNRSLGFSMFQRNIPSELESTRITPCSGTRNDDKLPLNVATEQSDANESSRIIRSCRKVVPNRILDFSDEDHDTDQSFEPNASESGDDSESSDDEQVVVKPTPTRRKRNQFVFLDLTCQEVIEDEEHENPDATPDELDKVVETFLESLQTKTNVETPAPNRKANVPSVTTKRKLFTPNYDDQTPFEETRTPERLPSKNNDKTIQLKTPIPSYLIPSQFRDKAKVDELKKLQTPRTPAPVKVCGFMESLDANLIPDEHCDVDALKFRNKFKQNRGELIKRLMKVFNHYVFDNKLANVPVTWNKKLTKTAGLCRLRKRCGVRIAPIELSEKINTKPDRLRDTLIHELCHAATWIVDGSSEHHGKVWKYWADRSNKRFPELPKIVRCHNYDIAYKYTYKCAICGLKSQSHSSSKKVENIRCAACHGPIELFLNKQEPDGTVTLIPPKEPSIFAKFVKENYKLHKVSGTTHADVMKILSNNFGKLTVDEKLKFKN